MGKTILVVAGTSVAVEEKPLELFRDPLRNLYRGFIRARGPATHQVTVTYSPEAAIPKFKAVPCRILPDHRGNSRRILPVIDGHYPLSDSSLLVGFLNGALAYTPFSRKGHIHLFRSPGKNYILGSLYKLLFCLMAVVLAEEGKLMVHGAGLRIGAKGHLFLGASGAGKSTVAGYAGLEGVLSDDAPIVTRDRGLFKIHASPFSQIDLFREKPDDHHRLETPLTRLVFLHQARHLRLNPRDKKTALAELLQNHVHGMDIMNEDLKRQVFHYCCDLCEFIPAFDLFFQKNGRFLSLFGGPGPSPGRQTP